HAASGAIGALRRRAMRDQPVERDDSDVGLRFRMIDREHRAYPRVWRGDVRPAAIQWSLLDRLDDGHLGAADLHLAAVGTRRAGLLRRLDEGDVGAADLPLATVRNRLRSLRRRLDEGDRAAADLDLSVVRNRLRGLLRRLDEGDAAAADLDFAAVGNGFHDSLLR